MSASNQRRYALCPGASVRCAYTRMLTSGLTTEVSGVFLVQGFLQVLRLVVEGGVPRPGSEGDHLERLLLRERLGDRVPERLVDDLAERGLQLGRPLLGLL